jgi:hypothetical protein
MFSPSPSPFDLQILVTARQADLLREASNARLARLVSRPSTSWRCRTAEALYALAVRLDPCAVPQRSPAPMVTS